MKVYIMRGASGSGKSTWVKQNLPGALVLSADDYFMKDGVYQFDPAKLPQAHDECLSEFLWEVAVKPSLPSAGKGKNKVAEVVVVDNTNTKAFEIAPYYRLAEISGHEVEVVWVVAPAEVCKARTTHGTPPATIDGMVNGVEALPPWWKVRVVVNP